MNIDEENSRYFRVNTTEELFWHQGSNFDIEDGMLYIKEYRDVTGFKAPACVPVAAYVPDFWLSVVEIDEDAYDEETKRGA